MSEILISGCGRGGTTATAGVIRHLGVPFPKANEHNEQSALFMAARGHRWDDFEAELALYRARYAQWAFKCPNITRHQELLLSVMRRLNGPVLVHVWRDPLSIAKRRHEAVLEAMKSRPHITEVQTQEEIFQHLVAVEMPMRAAAVAAVALEFPVLEVSYEKLIVNTSAEVDRIRDWLGLPTDKMAAAVAYVQPGAYRPWNGPKEENESWNKP